MSVAEQVSKVTSHHIAATLRWVVLSVAIVAVASSGLWVWQNGIPSTLDSLPFVDSGGGQQVQTASTTYGADAGATADTQRSASAQSTTGEAPVAPGSATGDNGVADAASSSATAPDAEDLTRRIQAAVSGETTALSAAETADGAASTAAGTSRVATSSQLIAVVGAQDTQLHEIAEGAALYELSPGTKLSVAGKSDDGSWLYVDSGGDLGWVEADSVVAFGTQALPVVPVTTPAVVAPAALSEAGQPPSGALKTALAVEAAGDPSANGDAVTARADVDDSAQNLATSNPAATDLAPETMVRATVSLTDARLNVRSAPNTDSVIVAKAYPAEQFAVLAQDATGEWLQVAVAAADGGTGWISAQYVNLSGPADALPIYVGGSASSDSSASASSQASESQTSAAVAPASTTASGLQGTLVFQSAPGTIYAYDLDTGEVWPLTRGFDPAISPDGTTVAFTRDGGEHGLYLINIDGSIERRIYAGHEALSSPKWNDDGSQILFTYRTDEVVELGGRGGPGGGSDNADSQMTEYFYHLAVVDSNGENYRDIPALNSARAADWAGSAIVYQSEAGIQMTSEGNLDENRLVAFDYLNPYYFDPDLQPAGDGTGGQIVFMQREASHWELYRVNLDGSGMAALTKPVTALVDELPSNVSPAYSPDGQRIAYLSNRGEGESAGDWQIWIMEADGSNAQSIPVGVEIEYTFGNEQAVSWGR